MNSILSDFLQGKAWFLGLLLILLVGCSSGGDRADLRPEGTKPAQSSAKPNSQQDVVQGFAVKGTVRGGLVTAFLVDGNGVKLDQPIGSAVTDAQGLYQMSIDDIHLGKPVLLRLESAADGSTEMVCDLVDGCGSGVQFGQVHRFVSDPLSMELMVPSIENGKFANFSLFSSMAAHLVRSQLSPSDSEAQVQQKLKSQNALLTNYFGLAAYLPELILVDVLNDIQGVTALELKHTLLNNALLAGALSANPGLSFGATIESLIQTDELNTVDNYGVVAEAAKQLRALGLDVHPRAGFVLSDLNAQLAMMSSKSAMDLKVSDTLFSSPQEQGKRIVKEIRDVGGSLDLVALSKLTDISLDTIIDIETSPLYKQFLGRATAAKLMSKDATEVTLDAFLQVFEAILRIIGDEAENGAFANGTHVVESENGVSVTYTKSDMARRFLVQDRVNVCGNSVSQSGQACFVDVNFAVDMAGRIGVGTIFNSERVSVDLDLDVFEIGGTFASQGQRIVVQPGSQINADILKFEFEDSTDNNGSGLYTDLLAVFMAAQNLDVEINLMFESLDQAATEQMLQSYRIEANELVLTYEDKTSVNEISLVSVTNTEWLIESMKTLSATIAGEVIDDQSRQSNFAINLVSDAQGEVFQFQSREREVCAMPNDESACAVDEVDIPQEEMGDFVETEDRFLATSYHFVFDADYSAIVEPVQATLAGQRRTKDENSLVVGVRYPGHYLTMEGEVDIKGQIQRLDAINQDGSQVFITKPNNKDRDGSVIAANGEVVAPIIEMGEWIKIPFADGFFQSL